MNCAVYFQVVCFSKGILATFGQLYIIANLVIRVIPYAAFRCSCGGIVILGYRGSDGDDRFPGEVLSRRAIQEAACAGEWVLQVQRPTAAGVHFVALHRRLGVHLLRLLGDQKAWTQDEHAGRRPRLSGRRRPKLRRCECGHAHLRAIVHGVGCGIRKPGITLPNFSFLFISIKLLGIYAGNWPTNLLTWLKPMA